MAGETFIGQPWRQPYTAQQLQDAAKHQVPIVGSNGNWWRWDIDTSDWVDTGVTVATSLADSSVTWPKLAPEARKSNPNLIENWYLADPVNQRGQPTYSNTTWGALYCIDRWYLSVAEWNVAEHKLTTNANFGRFVQRLNGKALVGKTVTFSALVSSVEGGDLQLFVGPGDIGGVTMPAGSSGLISLTVTMHDPGERTNDVFIALNTAGASAVIDAVKLELGPHQTLAYESGGGGYKLIDPAPNFTDELMRCLRYQLKLSTYTRYRMADYNPNEIRFLIPTPVPLRVLPTISNPENFLVRELNSIGVNGFTFNAAVHSSEGIVVSAIKNGHSLTDAELIVGSDIVILDANL